MSARIIRADGEALAFEATTRLSFGRAVNVTAHPVEAGADVSDNAQADGETIQISGLVGVDTGGDAPDRARAFLDRIAVAGELVAIEHPRLGRREAMVCEGYTVEGMQARALTFAASFRQIRTVQPFVVEIPAGQPPPVAADLAAAQDSGRQAATESPPAQAARARSIAASLADLVGL